MPLLLCDVIKPKLKARRTCVQYGTSKSLSEKNASSVFTLRIYRMELVGITPKTVNHDVAVPIDVVAWLTVLTRTHGRSVSS